ncbi:MAG: hypothetical protein CVV27_13900, partial [Candidatus Melainabacteria bacterium HGW-Melainabacteria-1]
LMPQLNQWLKQSPEATLRQLERLAPALQEWSQTNRPKPETLAYLLHQISSQVLPAHDQDADAESEMSAVFKPTSQSSRSAQGPFQLPDHPLERTLLRFYPNLSSKGLETARQQLVGASPAQMEGFYQLHRLLGLLDTGKPQSLASLWEQPAIYARLAQLGNVLSPVLDTVSQSPERRYLSPPTLQNQLLQAIQTWLLQGRPEALQNALQQWLQPQTAFRSPMGRIKEQLAGFGIQQAPETLLEEIWSLSQGSADAVDAMGLLIRGGYPLIRPNLQAVMQYIEHLPPQWRRQGVSDILLHLSPQLLRLIDQQISATGDFSRFGSLLAHDLPLQSQNWSRLEAPVAMPDFARDQNLGELRQLLQQILTHFSSALPPQASQSLTKLDQLIQKFQTQLQSLPGLVPEATQAPALKQLSEISRQLLSLSPMTPNTSGTQPGVSSALPASSTSPASSWIQMLQPALSREAPVLLMQVQDQLSGLFYQLKTLLPKLDARSELPITHTTPDPTRLAQAERALQAPAPDLDAIAQHLQHWGLTIQSPEMLQQIQMLMAGSQERLDAMAVLLKGQMPLLPAHIAIVAEYVRNLPPSERFTSISKILSFLSDELLAHMKQELSSQREQVRHRVLGDLEPEQSEQAEALLHKASYPLTEQRLQAARVLSGSALPQQAGVLQAIGHLLTSRHAPQQWLGPLQQLLGQMQSLLPAQAASQSAVLAQLQSTLGEALSLLQPKTNQIGNWMMGVSAQLNNVSERLSEQVRSLGPAPAKEDHWLGQLLSSLLGLCSWLEQEDPQLAEQVRRYRSQLREQMPSLRQSFESLAFIHGAEATAQQSAQTITQYLPVMLQSLGYPAEILVRQGEEDPHAPGQRKIDVELAIQTHTLGQVYLTLHFAGNRLQIRVGLERRETQRWMAPYLEALQQKLAHLSLSINSIQSYVVPPERQAAPVLAHHLHRRYGRSAIDKL